MRVTREELDQALNQVRAVFTPETVDRLRENDLFRRRCIRCRRRPVMICACLESSTRWSPAQSRS